jgi:hypothetical protein
MAMGSSRRPSPPVRVRAEVFAVGRRVYVMCQGSARMILMDETGKTPLASLDDGVEVSILDGGRAGPATRATACVPRCPASKAGPEASLRGTEVVVPVAPPSPAVADPAGSGRRFGESGNHR